jgi:phosphoribosylformylglycinamidine (FGAM) synthase-like enzyme
VVCAGGEPLAVTNCLNFGNPYKPEVYWTFQEAVAGMGEACRALGTPVTGGNVSFYNESPGPNGTTRAVFPTPTIGMVGLVEDVARDATTAAFSTAGDAVLLLSPAAWVHRGDVGGSEYLAALHGTTAGRPPHLDLDEEKAVQAAALAAIRAGLVRAAHDVSDGGLAVCLAEMAVFGGLGAAVDLRRPEGLRLDALLHGEAQSRIVLAVAPRHAAEVEALAVRHGAWATPLGQVGGDRLRIDVDGEPAIDAAVAALAARYEGALPEAMGEAVAAV